MIYERHEARTGNAYRILIGKREGETVLVTLCVNVRIIYKPILNK
jgi:hypothetical protein